MIILDATNEILEMVLDAAVATSQLQWTVSYIDITTTTYTPTNSDGASNSTTDVTLVASPQGSHQLQIKQITIYNADTVAATVTIKKDTATVEKILCKVTIQPSGTLQYNDTEGFNVISASGESYVSPAGHIAISAGTQSSNGHSNAMVFSNSNSVSFGMNESNIVTASYNYRTLTISFMESPHCELQAYSVPTAGGSQSFQRILIPFDIVATRLDYIGILTEAAATVGTWSVSVGVYTRGSGQSNRSLFSASSSFGSSTWNSGGATNNSDSYSGNSGTRIRTVSLDSWNFTPGEYWFAFNNSASGPSGTTPAISIYGQSALSVRGKIGSDNEQQGIMGILSVTQSNFMDELNLHDLIFAAQGGNANIYKQPYFRLYGTY